MVTRILNLMGVYFGPEGIAPDTNIKNRSGLWERKDVHDLNNELLLASKTDWHRVANFSLDQIPDSTKKKFHNKARKIIFEIDANRPWALKDPRFCLLFSLWREFLEVPVCIYVHRHPIQIAQSMAKHHAFPIQFSLALWERYTVDAFHNISDLPLVTVMYEDIVADPITAVHQLYLQLQKIGLKGLRLPTNKEIQNFIDHDRSYQKDRPQLQNEFIIAEQQSLSEDIINNHSQLTAHIMRPKISQGGYQNLLIYEKQQQMNFTLREQIKINQKLKEKLLLQSKQLQHIKMEQATLATRLRQIKQEHAVQVLELEQYIYWIQNLSVNFKALLRLWRQKSNNTLTRILEILSLRQKTHLPADYIQNIFNIFNTFENSRFIDPKSTINKLHNISSTLSEKDVITQTRKSRLTLLPQLREDKAPAGSAFVRVLLPYNSVAVKQQWHVEINPVDTLPQLGTAEVLLIQREALEVDISKYDQWINQWKNTGGKLIYELDDDLLDSQSLAKRNHSLNSELVVKKAQKLIQHADLVTVSTLALAERIRSLNENIVVMPNYLDAHLWKLASPRNYQAKDPKGPIKIGYIGTQTHDQDLEVITEAMQALQEKYGSNITIEIIGAFQNKKCLFGTKVPLPTKTDYPSFVCWLLEHVYWDIGIIPLFDDEFNKCKSHLKFLEYAALEMAIVCSDAPTYQVIARDGINSLVVDNTTSSWYSALTKLIEDQALRTRLARAARIEVINRHTIDLIGKSYLNILASFKADSDHQKPLEFQKKVASTLKRIENNSLPPVIIIPVYNAPDEVKNCLESILFHTKIKYRVIVINDASTDPHIHSIFEHYKNISSIEIYHNEKNLGYTRTINRGIELAGTADVVFLNSDTQVIPRWLHNLQFAAYSGEKIGTATPFSNNAGAFSAPEIGKENPLPSSLSLAEYGRLISHISLRFYPSTPTGNGFCMYVRRDCLDETGFLDAQAFPRGYGEENDFCMRANRLGWTHVIDDATLIYHVRSASFGEEKHELMKQGRKIIDERYPEYTESVKHLINNQVLKQARDRIRHVSTDRSLDQLSGKPRLLFVLSTRTGGVPQTNRDLMMALQDRIDAFVLQGDPNRVSLLHFHQGSSIELNKQDLNSPLQAFPHRSDDYDEIVTAWLVRYSIELIHIRHIAWHSLGLIKAAKKIGIPVVFSFHDFYTVCPTVNLLDENFIFCAGTCTTTTKGQCRHALWKEPNFPALKHAGIKTWQRNFEKALKDCDIFITTSESTKQILTHIYPLLNNKPFKIIPHGRDFVSFENLMQPLQPNEPIRILVPGNISPSKGEHIIIDLGQRSITHHFQIHVLGKVQSKLGKNVIVHGTYNRDEFSEKVREIKPHIGGIFSICAETYSHTLTELWACGIPVIGFDLGAVGDRIGKTAGGWLAREISANGVLEIIQKLRSSPEELSIKQAAVRIWQDNEGKQHDCDWMARHYAEIYQSFIPDI